MPCTEHTNFGRSRSSHWVHWLVLSALLLGQFALGAGYGVAAEQSNDELRIPVCTSTGIQYIVWTPQGIEKDTGSDSDTWTSAGTCVLCTTSPVQFRFDTQRALFDDVRIEDLCLIEQNAQLVSIRFVLNPHACPRAPPTA